MRREKPDLERFEILLTTYHFRWKERFRAKRLKILAPVEMERQHGDGHLEQRKILQTVILKMLADHGRVDFDALFNTAARLRSEWSRICLGREKVLASRERLEEPERKRRERIVRELKAYRKGRLTWDLLPGETIETIDYLLDKLSGHGPTSERLRRGQAHIGAFREKAHKALIAVSIPKGLPRFRQKLLRAFPEGTPEPTPANLHDGLLMAWGLVEFRQAARLTS